MINIEANTFVFLTENVAKNQWKINKLHYSAFSYGDSNGPGGISLSFINIEQGLNKMLDLSTMVNHASNLYAEIINSSWIDLVFEGELI